MNQKERKIPSFKNLTDLHRVCVCGRQQLWRVSRRPRAPFPTIPSTPPPPMPALPPMPPHPIPAPTPAPPPPKVSSICLVRLTLGMWMGKLVSATGTNCPPCSDSPISPFVFLLLLLLKLISREPAIYWLLMSACTTVSVSSNSHVGQSLKSTLCFPSIHVPHLISHCDELAGVTSEYLHLWTPPLQGVVIGYFPALHCQPPWVDTN